MFMIVSTFLGKWGKYILPALLVISIFIYWQHRNNIIDDLQQENARLQDSIKTYIANEETLKKSIEEQNQSIKLAHQQYKKQNDALKMSIEKLKQQTINIDANLQLSLSKLKDAPTLQTCEEAFNFLVDTAIKYPVNVGNK